MRFLPRKVALPVAAILAAAGCASLPYGSDPISRELATRARGRGFPEEQILTSARLFNAKCVRCHKAYDPADYSKADWEVWMEKMAKKSKLTPEQAELISKYTAASRPD
jgi:hypothetical protein